MGRHFRGTRIRVCWLAARFGWTLRRSITGLAAWVAGWPRVLVTLGIVALLVGAPVPSAVDPAASMARLSAPVEPPWRVPLTGSVQVVRPFDPPERPWLPGHRGLDLTGEPGGPVLAAGAGVVRFAGPVADRRVVSIDHGAGLRTTYEPVLPLVRAGQVVATGDLIATLAVGHAGCPGRACLHWGLRSGSAYLNPLVLVRPGRARLLPVTIVA